MRSAITLTFLFAAIVSLACSRNTYVENTSIAATPAPPAATPVATPVAVADGRALYVDNCAACHKENGTGGKMEIEGRKINPDDLTSEKIKGFSDDKIARYIRDGVEDEGMPSFKDKLSDAQIAEVIKYVRTTIQKKS